MIGEKNTYVCMTCRKTIVTIDVDEGVTPFTLKCLATEGCHGIMYSSLYANQAVVQTPTHEWFMPKSFKGYSREMIEHFQKGGLDIRPVATVHFVVCPTCNYMAQYPICTKCGTSIPKEG